MSRTLFLLLGLSFMALGVVGAFVPLLPTTVFLILAAGCFARSSPRLEAWLMNHNRFGPTLRAWREHGVIPRPAKVMACAGMVFGFAVFFAAAHPQPWLAVAVAAALAACAAFVLSRPSVSR
ncbi:YbaN family protein [Phenylobacterium sp.]|uniref:YbaN family protein n=1 Tax=Phenylobacterium sp. TaxID=1871053 RepID=UPI002732D563|nr:YbaN family protein [Phenylobacterium sp.]MDP3853237.1 YbaN family protein [Phenylobacterium sp.]